MPVHRLQHDKRGSVYAYATELDAWRESRRQLLDTEPAIETRSLGPVVRRRLRPLFVAAIAVALTISAGGVWWLQHSSWPKRHTPNPEAVRLVRQAVFAGNAGRVQIQTSIRYLQEALRLDPEFSGAWSALATAHLAATWFGEAQAAETMTQARREAQEALRLDPSNSAAWRVLAFVSHYLDWNHSAAEVQFRKAIDLTPRNAVVLSWYADFLTDLLRFDEARAHYHRAQAASPRWLEPITFAANIHTYTGHPDLAIAEQRRVLESEPNFGLGLHFLGRSYLAKGDYPNAIDQLRKSNQVLGGVPFSMGDLGYALALSGQRGEAEAILADLMAKRAQGYYPAFPIAQIHLGLGESDMALDWLDYAAEERHLGFYLPSVDPMYDSLRSHPRFKRLMQRINIQVPGH